MWFSPGHGATSVHAAYIAETLLRTLHVRPGLPRAGTASSGECCGTTWQWELLCVVMAKQGGGRTAQHRWVPPCRCAVGGIEGVGHTAGGRADHGLRLIPATLGHGRELRAHVGHDARQRERMR
jgi:hypothetical protein